MSKFWEQVFNLLAGSLTKAKLSGMTSDPKSIGGAVAGTFTPPTFAGAIPQRPPLIPRPSPNFKRTPGRRPTCVVIHATATPGLLSPLGWLCNPASKVSAHYLIDTNGMVYKLVHEEDVSWHAGASFWQGRSGVNEFSIGIELVHPNDGFTPYAEPQLTACAQLTRAICAEYGISAYNVIGHADVAPGRKNDPLAFDWYGFRLRLA